MLGQRTQLQQMVMFALGTDRCKRAPKFRMQTFRSRFRVNYRHLVMLPQRNGFWEVWGRLNLARLTPGLVRFLRALDAAGLT